MVKKGKGVARKVAKAYAKDNPKKKFTKFESVKPKSKPAVKPMPIRTSWRQAKQESAPVATTTPKQEAAPIKQSAAPGAEPSVPEPAPADPQTEKLARLSEASQKQGTEILRLQAENASLNRLKDSLEELAEDHRKLGERLKSALDKTVKSEK